MDKDGRGGMAWKCQVATGTGTGTSCAQGGSSPNYHQTTLGHIPVSRRGLPGYTPCILGSTRESQSCLFIVSSLPLSPCCVQIAWRLWRTLIVFRCRSSLFCLAEGESTELMEPQEHPRCP